METGFVVRELAEAVPVVGWRVWVVMDTEEGLRLGSVIHEGRWTPGTTALAACRRQEDVFAAPLPPHPTPSAECACGFHAARDSVDALAYLRGRDDPTTVCRIVGEVALWGRLVETERGWRASAAYPVRLYVPDDAIAGDLEVYGVPVLTDAGPGDVALFTCQPWSARSMKSVRTRL